MPRVPHILIAATTVAALINLCHPGAAKAQGEEAGQSGTPMHRVVKLVATLDGNQLTVELRSLVANIAGSQNQPSDKAEKTAIFNGLGTLIRSDMVVPAAAAGCRSNGFNAEFSQSDAAVRLGWRKDGDDDQKNNNSNDSKHQFGLGVGSAATIWTYTCSAPAALDSFQVNLFQHVPGLTKVDASFVGPEKQTAATLTADNALFTLR